MKNCRKIGNILIDKKKLPKNHSLLFFHDLNEQEQWMITEKIESLCNKIFCDNSGYEKESMSIYNCSIIYNLTNKTTKINIQFFIDYDYCESNKTQIHEYVLRISFYKKHCATHKNINIIEYFENDNIENRLYFLENSLNTLKKEIENQ
jgi:hypothetical protein